MYFEWLCMKLGGISWPYLFAAFETRASAVEPMKTQGYGRFLSWRCLAGRQCAGFFLRVTWACLSPSAPISAGPKKPFLTPPEGASKHFEGFSQVATLDRTQVSHRVPTGSHLNLLSAARLFLNSVPSPHATEAPVRSKCPGERQGYGCPKWRVAIGGPQKWQSFTQKWLKPAQQRIHSTNAHPNSARELVNHAKQCQAVTCSKLRGLLCSSLVPFRASTACDSTHIQLERTHHEVGRKY